MFLEMQALLGTSWAYLLSFGALIIWWVSYKLWRR